MGKEETALSLSEKGGDFSVIYEDDAIIVLEKKAGQVVHPPGASPAISEFILSRIKDTERFEDPLRAGIVHRLDKPTHGVLVCAKTPWAEASLKAQFKARQVHKLYLALVRGPIYSAGGILDSRLGSSPSFRKRQVKLDGKEALTEYRILRRTEKRTLVEIILHTGRRHQIRLHFAHIRHPVIGDHLYARSEQGHPHLMLCAKELEFEHPERRERVKFLASLPDYFQAAMEEMDRD